MSRRQERINRLMRQEISELLAREVKDPRLPSVTSVTYVDVSADLRYAKVSVSVLGRTAEKENALLTLNSAAGFLRRSLRQRLRLRTVPDLIFSLDDSIERSQELISMLDNLSDNDEFPTKALS
jgi:ribosome-binding factor A